MIGCRMSFLIKLCLGSALLTLHLEESGTSKYGVNPHRDTRHESEISLKLCDRKQSNNCTGTEMKVGKFCFSVALVVITCTSVAAQFIYLNSGVFKFIAGIGLPIDVEMPGGSLSWFTNVQVFYKLPDNITYFEPYKVMHKRSMKNTFNRANLYEALLRFSERLGFSGSDCIHRLICEVAHRRINRSVNGLLGEITHILFTPGHDSSRGLEEYKAAERQGSHNGSACEVIYKNCFLRGNAILL